MNVTTILCQVIELSEDEEKFVGNINVLNVPRVGEYIWFSEKRENHYSWLVETVAHHVGNGELGSYPGGYQRVVIYAIPAV